MASHSVRTLRISDVIFRWQGSVALWVINLVFGTAMSLFFRRIEVVNAERLPEDGGVIFVGNHPNALIDPALLFIALPRRIAFLAKSTLFKIPVLGYLIKVVGALPLYRQKDEGADVSKNLETFSVVRGLLKKGGAIAIFPEGVSHNESQLQPLKTGAARIALGTVSSGRDPASLELRIVPVGLFYTSKATFRSEALLYIGEPLSVSPVRLDENGQPPRDGVRALTAKIEVSLREVTLNAESDLDISIARVAEEVISSTTQHRENLAQRLETLRNFVEAVDSDERLESRLAQFDEKLERFGIESEFLALAEYPKRFILKHALLRSWYLLLLSPLVIVGVVIHFPAYQVCRFAAYLQTRKGEHDMASTVKVIGGVLLIPVTWILIALLVGFWWGWVPAVISVPFNFICGYAALRSMEEIEEMKGWLRAISLFVRKREKFLRLLAERRRLYEKMSG